MQEVVIKGDDLVKQKEGRKNHELFVKKRGFSGGWRLRQSKKGLRRWCVGWDLIGGVLAGT